MGKMLRGMFVATALFVTTHGAAFVATTEMAAPDPPTTTVRQAPLVIEIENIRAGDADLSNTPRDNDDDHANN